MFSKNIIDEAKKCLNSLEDNQHIELNNNDGLKLLGKEEMKLFAIMSKEMKTDKIVGDLEQYYNFPDKLELQWDIKIGNKEDNGGELSLTNPLTSFFYNELENPILKIVRKYPLAKKGTLCMLDQFPNSGTGNLTLLKVDKDLTNAIVLFFTEDATFEMDLTIEQYFEAAFLSRGFLGWQYLFIKTDDIALRKELKKLYLQPMMEILPKLFPKDNFKMLNDKLTSF